MEQAKQAQDAQQHAGQDVPLSPQIDFPTFVLSFFHMGLVHLGEAPAGEGMGTQPVNLAQAKHFIDILDMLKDKTKGNLDREEAKFMKSILFDLQMKYVEKCKQFPDSNCADVEMK